MTTITIIGINLVLWVSILLTGRYESLLLRLTELSPLGSCLTADLSKYWPGATAANCALESGMVWVPGVSDGGFWQVLTSAFAHVEIWHIAGNLLALWFLGPVMERSIGRVRFLVLYLLSALGGSAAIMWFSDPNGSTLGASGAVFGMIGAMLVVTWKVRGDFRSILVWLGINVVLTFTVGGISWQGHLGGLISGVLVAAILVFTPRVNRERWQWLGFVALSILIIGATIARAMMLHP